MKKLSVLIIVSLLASLFMALPALATPLQPQKGFKTPEERAAYEAYFNEKTDWTKKLRMGKDFLNKFTDSEWKVDVKRGNLNALLNLFQAAVQAFDLGPDAVKLEQVLSVGDEYRNLSAELGLEPEHFFVVGQMAMKSGFGLLLDFYKDAEKTRGYAEKSLKLLESATPPKGFETGDGAAFYTGFRNGSLGYLNQYIGLSYLKQATPDADQAIKYLTAAVETKTWATAKDANTYSLRAQANNIIYAKLSNEYSSLSEDDKRGEKGKEALAKIDPVVDKMIDDYARAVSLLTDPRAKAQHDDAKSRLTDLYKYRHNKAEGIEELINYYKADPTAPPMVIKVSADEGSGNKALPTADAPKLDASKTADPKAASKSGKAAASKTAAGKTTAGKTTAGKTTGKTTTTKKKK